MRLLALCSLFLAGLALAQDPAAPEAAAPTTDTPTPVVHDLPSDPAVLVPDPAGPPPLAVPVSSGPLFPSPDWARATPAEVGLDPAALDRLTDYLFARNGDDVDRKGQRTNAFVLVKDGKVVVERYARETTATTPLLTWSVSKSIGATLVGVAVGQGLVDIDAPVGKYIPAMNDSGHRDVRVRDLMYMSSGLAWNETYEAAPFTSSALAMLYGRGRLDMPGYVARHRVVAPPGTRWMYSSGDANLLGAVLRAAVGEERWTDWPWTSLFDPVGMRNVVFERDAKGNLVSSSYFYAPATEIAKWGWLLLQDGVWDGQRVLPEGWLQTMTTMAPAWYTMAPLMEHYEDDPGAQIYLNHGDPRRGIPAPWPDLPEDAFAALGHWGKAVFVIPSWDMVVVRMGDDREYGCVTWGQTDCQPDRTKAYTKPYFLELLAAAVPGGGDGKPWEPLPAPNVRRQEGNPSSADTLNFGPVPSVYQTKELCSCVFVEGRSDQQCLDYVHQSAVPVKNTVIDREQKTVRASSLGITSTSRWKGPRDGCGVDTPAPIK